MNSWQMLIRDVDEWLLANLICWACVLLPMWSLAAVLEQFTKWTHCAKLVTNVAWRCLFVIVGIAFVVKVSELGEVLMFYDFCLFFSFACYDKKLYTVLGCFDFLLLCWLLKSWYVITKQRFCILSHVYFDELVSDLLFYSSLLMFEICSSRLS